MSEWGENLIYSLVTILIVIIVLILVKLIVNRLNKTFDGVDWMPKESRQQAKTFIQIIAWVVRVLAISIGVLMVLSHFGVDIGPLLAGIGIAGLAVSLGAQTLIKDFIGGFLILAEKQFVIGDEIQLEAVSGQVERITLRATYLRDIRGIEYIVPNGEIRIVANYNKGWANAIAEVNIPYDEDLNNVQVVLKNAADAFAAESDYSPDVLGEPRVVGPVASTDWTVTMRVSLKVKPDKRLEIGRELQIELLKALRQAGISKPYPRKDLQAPSGE